MATNKPLLDLSTDKYLGHIVIDEKPYGLLHPDNLSILQQQEMQSLGKQLVKVSASVKVEKDEKKYNKIMLSILLLVMPDAGGELLSKLSITKKYQAVEAYNTAVEELKKKKSLPNKAKKNP